MLLLMKKKTTPNRVEITGCYYREKIRKSNIKTLMKKYTGVEEPLLLHAGKEARPE